jgi:exodeoxyribonuclease V beta subunit
LIEMKRLDVMHAPLDGLHLIEANAGTGKTWTITALYLRLLLEAQRSVESILVVTFTDAATAELRDRIRNRLAAARLAFERGSANDDDVFLAGLLGRVADRGQAVLQTTSALRNFDQAPIYTIHGFCQRVLGDRAFESGMPFETEILPDESVLLQEITDDFWRRTLYGASTLFVRYVLDRKLDPEKLKLEVKGRVGKPYLDIRKPQMRDDIAALERAYEAAHVTTRTIWLKARAAIMTQLVEDTSLNASKYAKTALPDWSQQMDACLGSESAGVGLFKAFGKFTARALEAGVKKGMTPPRHPFYEACGKMKAAHEALDTAYDRYLSVLKAQLLEYCNGELAARKQGLRLQSFDDLLLNLDRALDGDRGEVLAGAIRERYTAALIDEFQDTDPVQYRIFNRVYGGTGLPVFLVGDPKQSIYSFRGADVFAYLSARRGAQHGHTLDVNWRSEPGLLAAVNALFGGAPAPFVIGEIPFLASEPAAGSRGHLVIDDEARAPFQFWLVGGENGKALTKEAATRLATQATAAEIARLLNLGARGKARIGEAVNGGIRERALSGGDVAVLVRNHRQAWAVRHALRDLGVASVERGSESVFESHEAEELERVLMAIAEPGREALIRAALTTEMVGYSGVALQEISGDETRWEQMIETFRAAHGEWRDHGFVRMARAFFQHFEVMCRLLEREDGERRITNLLHLVELIHREAGRHGIGAAMEWLSQKRKTPEKSNEGELLRLESDENLVKILTVHAAKGLEYPLVFCPFLWDGKIWAKDAAAITFHDPEDGYAAVLDMGSDALETYRPLAQREELAENVRMLYVALTRARYRCCMVWGNVKEAGTSAAAWLLHGAAGEGEPSTGIMLTETKIRADLERIETRAAGVIEVAPIPIAERARFVPTETKPPTLAARAFTGTVRDASRLTSFSGLAHAQSVETPDYDALAHRVEIGRARAAQDIFAFPRGARAGRCLHAIFEQADFTDASRAGLERLIARELAAHDFAAHWIPVVADMVQNVVATPLDASGHLRLDRVPAAGRFNELEFYYPIAGLSDLKLRSILLDWGFPDEIRERIGAFTFAPAQGFMKGFIDLVFEVDGRFYLADYKSNWLGASLEAYRQSDLRKVMAREAYYLQYLVYCVALHRYLALRVPGYDYESHFGGVRYLFLRGMRPESGLACGVYADLPAYGLIAALDGYLGNG